MKYNFAPSKPCWTSSGLVNLMVTVPIFCSGRQGDIQGRGGSRGREETAATAPISHW